MPCSEHDMGLDMRNNPQNDVRDTDDLIGQAEQLERVAVRLRAMDGGATAFCEVQRDLVVRASDWVEAEHLAVDIADLYGVAVAATSVRWPLGAGLYRVRVVGHQVLPPAQAAA